MNFKMENVYQVHNLTTATRFVVTSISFPRHLERYQSPFELFFIRFALPSGPIMITAKVHLCYEVFSGPIFSCG